MAQHPTPASPRPAWPVHTGLITVGLGTILTLLQLGAIVAVVGVFALSGDAPLVALGLAATWLVVAVASIVALVHARRGRAWPRIVLAALAVAAGGYAISIEHLPVGPGLVLVGVALHSLAIAQRRVVSRADSPPTSDGPGRRDVLRDRP